MLQGICSQVVIQPVCFPLSFNNFLMEAVSSLFCPVISYLSILPHFLVHNCCQDLISDPFHFNGCLQQSVFPSPCLESSWQRHLQSVHPKCKCFQSSNSVPKTLILDLPTALCSNCDDNWWQSVKVRREWKGCSGKAQLWEIESQWQDLSGSLGPPHLLNGHECG